MAVPRASGPDAERSLLFLASPCLWPHWPFLPVVRRAPGRPEELGVVIDLWRSCGLPGYSATVFVSNLFEVSRAVAQILCGIPSDRVHSRYTRTVADLPWQGRQVVLRITARRFRCRVVFCERFPATLARHARVTDRLTDAHRAVGFALGGEAGSRLCNRLHQLCGSTPLDWSRW